MLYQSFITNNPYLKGTNVIIGVSGGVDSMTLLDLCTKVCKSVYVVHVNYQLRREQSDADEELVKHTCKTLGIKCKVVKPGIAQLKGDGINLQQAAREIRYLAYSEMLEEEKADYILTGHTADDSVETMVFNFFRGTDIKGLTGINNQEIIKRPLLSFQKDEIYQYAESAGIVYREDQSNQTEVYTRNLIRQSILPSIEQHLPSVTKRLQVTQEHIARAARFNTQVVDYLTKTFVEQNSEGHFIPFDRLDNFAFGLDFLVYWSRKYGFNQTQINQLYHTRQVGKHIEADKYQITVERLGLQLRDKGLEHTLSPVSIIAKQFTIALQDKSSFLTSQPLSSHYTIDDMIIDEKLLKLPLTIRTWEEGDRITYRANPKESKKLKKLFNDHKLSTYQKHQIPIVVNGDGQIIWVVSLQKSAFFAADKGFKISVVKSREGSF